MEGESKAIALEKTRLAALSDCRSPYYQAICDMMRRSESAAAGAASVKNPVVVAASLSNRDLQELEAQFSVKIKARGTNARAVFTPRVAGLVALIDAAQMEMCCSADRDVVWVDGDLVALMSRGLSGICVERSNASARLQAAYCREDELVASFGRVGVSNAGSMNVAAGLILADMKMGGGESFKPRVMGAGYSADVLLFNHFRTPVGLGQVAYMCSIRKAVAYGAFPFQVEMLTQLEGPLAAFPGKFYVDKVNDTITMVPESEPSMSVSHPYSSLMSMATNNAVMVDGLEFLCERYMSVKGVMYYVVQPVNHRGECPEVLRSYYYDPAALSITTVKYPRLKFSEEGVPVGWERAEIRMPAARYESVMLRGMAIATKVVMPSDVLTILMNENAMTVNTLDTAVRSHRMSVEDEEEVAVALALLINWRREEARSAYSVLADAVKKRYKVQDSSVAALTGMILVAWWKRVVSGKLPRVWENLKSDGELPLVDVLDSAGNDFSVVVRDVDPWYEVSTETGSTCVKDASEFVMHPWLPHPKKPSGGFDFWAVMDRAKRALTSRPKVVPSMPAVGAARVGITSVQPVWPGVVRAQVNEVPNPGKTFTLGEGKQTLLKKMLAEQSAIKGTPLEPVIEQYDSSVRENRRLVPVPDIDPVSALTGFAAAINNGLPERTVVDTGYRLAEVEINKVTEGTIAINDQKRNIPGPRYVREPKVDLSVEGKRISSQASLIGALFKRNIGVPANRGFVDLDAAPEEHVALFIKTCFRDNWKEIVQKYLAEGLWQPVDRDIESFLGRVDETKVKSMLKEDFMTSEIDLTKWNLMAKGKVKARRETEALGNVDHAQTIMFLQNQSTNAYYSSQVRLFKKCFDECLRPNIRINSDDDDVAHEDWYNSLNPIRASVGRTHSYMVDTRCYDRSQEHVALKTELMLYKFMGLNEQTLAIWEQTHGSKKASCMMYGVFIRVVLGGISGIFKTLLRNGVLTAISIVFAAELTARNIITFDVKGDDVDLETRDPVDVEKAITRSGLAFNFSSKFMGTSIRYMCKQFRVFKFGRWHFLPDIWAKAQSLCTPVWLGNHEESLHDRWVSFSDSMRYAKDFELLTLAAEVTRSFYSLPTSICDVAYSLSSLARDERKYINFFKAPRVVC